MNEGEVMRDLIGRTGEPKEIVAVPEKWSTRLEGGCPACVAKHLSQAILLYEGARCPDEIRTPGNEEKRKLLHRAVILDREAVSGYTGHRWLAAGCVAEAEALSSPCGTEVHSLRIARLAYVAGKVPLGGLGKALQAAVDDKYSYDPREVAWAHIFEAIAELPAADLEHRNSLLLRGVTQENYVPELTRILKSVIDLYNLEPNSHG